MKVQLDTNDPVALKIASALMTKAIRDQFNLHSQAMRKALAEDSKKHDITPQEAFRFLNEKLPQAVADFLKEVGSCTDNQGKRLDDAS